MSAKQQFILLISILFTTFQLSALTFTVTVPDGTNAVFIAGSFNGWNPTSHQLSKLDDNTFQIEIETTASGIEYKYCSGPDWSYVEKNASGSDIGNRSYNANDVVAKWGSVYNPTLTAGDITITANVPSNTPDGEVYIAGSFTNPSWGPEVAVKMDKVSATQYKTTISNVVDIQYKLLCGRSWENEELDADGGQIQNRTASVVSPNVNITVARWKNTDGPSANIISHTFSSFAPLQGSRRILIYLPPDYDTALDKSYPVLYMHDGQNVLETGPFGTWNVKNTLNNMYNAGKDVGIVVAIDNSAGRMSEYTPFPNSNYAPNPKGDDYLQAIIDHVIPYINSNYRTLSGRENTGICGSSLGGLISYYAALKEHETFGLIAPMSPSFWYCRNDLNSYLNNWNGNYKENTRINFICGNNEGDSDMVNDMQSFYNKTVQKGFLESNLKYEVVSGGTHSEGAWAAQFQRVYEFLFEKVFSNNKELIEKDFSKQIELNSSFNQLLINNKYKESVGFHLYNTNGALLKSLNLTPGMHHISLSKGSYIAKYTNNSESFSKKIVVN